MVVGTARLVRILCFAFALAVHAHCAKTIEYESKLRDAACTLERWSRTNVITSRNTSELEHCKSQVQLKEIEKKTFHIQLSLLCRDNGSMWLQVETSNDTKLQLDGDFEVANCSNPNILYRLMNTHFPGTEPEYYINDSRIHIDKLLENTEYEASATIVCREGHFIRIGSHLFTTLNQSIWNEETNSIDEVVHYEHKFLSNSKKTIDAVLTWDKTDVMTCFYGIYVTTGPYMNTIVQSNTLSYPGDPGLRSYTVENLMFGTRYDICVFGWFASNPRCDSPEVHIYTPSCHSFYENQSTSECDSFQPKNVKITYQNANDTCYVLEVVWDPARNEPFQYEVIVIDSKHLIYKPVYVSGSTNKTDIYVKKNELTGPIFINVTAVGFGGRGQSIPEQGSLDIPSHVDENRNLSNLDFSYKYVLITFVVLVTMIVVICWLYNQRAAQLDRTSPEPSPQTIIEHARELRPIDILQADISRSVASNSAALEIEVANIRIYGLIGQGAFGEVFCAHLASPDRIVAVKSLRANNSEDPIRAIRAFFEEIRLMIEVGSHPNILHIVGHVTHDVRCMLLVTEYCSEGSLRDFLIRVSDQQVPQQRRADALLHSLTVDTNDADQVSDNMVVNPMYENSRKAIAQRVDQSVDTDDADQVSDNMVVNPMYGKSHNDHPPAIDQPVDQQSTVNSTGRPQIIMEVNNPMYMMGPGDDDLCKPSAASTHPPSIVVSGADLLSMASQVATGMLYLARHKVLHRDLAARNVLVCADKTVRISDFGLSRDVYLMDEYQATRSTRMPYKWLALESLQLGMFKANSDVWSFGVLLHEMVTLGGVPYPTIGSSDELLQLLRAGRRLERWPDSSAQLYALQCDCWHEVPEQRPTFEALRDRLDRMRGEMANGVAEHIRLGRTVLAATPLLREDENVYMPMGRVESR